MDIHFEDERRFLWVRFTGLWVISKESPVTKQVLDECEARKQDLLLIDFSAVDNQKLTLAERFRLGMNALEFAGKLRRIAALVRPELADRQRFGEMVARNRGINVRVFTILEEATRWLLAQDQPSAPR
jgi:hypothetical protein